MPVPLLARSSSFRRRVARVLAIYCATIALLVLAPFVHPVAYELLCSIDGHRLVVVTDAGLVDAGDPAAHADPTGHCPLCMPGGALPGFVAWDFEPVQPLAHVRRSLPAARLASLLGAPLPARGPPTAI